MSHIQITKPTRIKESRTSQKSSKTKYAILGGLLVAALISIGGIIIHYKTMNNTSHPLQQEAPKNGNQVSQKEDTEYNFDKTQFKNTKLKLNDNLIKSVKLFESQLKETSIIVLTSFLDILYAIYPILSSSARKEIDQNFTNISNSIISEEKTSSSFLSSEDFKLLNYAILTKSIDYNKEYVDILKKDYKFDFEDMTKSSVSEKVNTLNEIVDKKTNGDIKDFFSEEKLNGSVFLLLSVVTFDFKWANKFGLVGEKFFFNTKEGKPDLNNSKNMDFMKLEHEDLHGDFYGELIIKEKSFVFYEKKIESTDKKISMFFIMPGDDKGQLSDLDEDIMKNISGRDINVGTESIKKIEGENFIMIPKFEVSKKNNFKDIMKNQHISQVFVENNNPLEEFSKENCFIGEFYQNVVLKVNELGVKGSAATVAVILMRGTTPKDVIFNRPFRYGLKVDGNLVFIGSFYGNDKEN